MAWIFAMVKWGNMVSTVPKRQIVNSPKFLRTTIYCFQKVFLGLTATEGPSGPKQTELLENTGKSIGEARLYLHPNSFPGLRLSLSSWTPKRLLTVPVHPKSYQSSFTTLQAGSQFGQYCMVNRQYLSPCRFLPPLSKISWALFHCFLFQNPAGHTFAAFFRGQLFCSVAWTFYSYASTKLSL